METYDEIEEEPIKNSDSSWLKEYDPRTNLEEFFILLSAIFMAIGMSVMLIGYIVPRDYEFNQDLPAREMEAIEIYYASLSFSLDICILVGMGLIALGGVIVSTIVMYSLVKGCEYISDEELDLRHFNNAGSMMTSYGSYNSR